MIDSLEITLTEGATVTVLLVDVPDLVVALVKAERLGEARSILARWWVAHTKNAGHSEWEVRP